MRLDHYQNGRAPPDVAAAPPRRRQLRGDRLGHRDRRDRRRLHGGSRRARRRVDLLLRRRRPGKPPRRRYSGAFLRALGVALPLERARPGEDRRVLGRRTRSTASHTRGDFEHAEVAVFVGKNPWMSQSFPRARVVLKEIASDPERSMIVIDPRRDRDRQARRLPPARAPGHATPGAWPRWSAVLVQEDLVDHAFLAAHASGAEVVLERARRRSTSPATPAAAASTRT